jgi:hypothetical protein
VTRVEIGHMRIGSAGERPHQVARVGLLAQPAREISGMRSCISATISLASVVLIAKVWTHSLACGGVLPIFPKPALISALAPNDLLEHLVNDRHHFRCREGSERFSADVA